MSRPNVLSFFLALAFAGCASAPAPAPSPGAAAPAVNAAAERPTPPPTEIVAPRVTPDAEFRAKLPAPGPERAFKLPVVKRFRLKSGVPVILAQSSTLPLVGIELVFKTGNAANPKELAGLADLTADLLDEGTKSRTAMQIADEISFLGASLGTNAGWDASQVSVSALKENIDEALAVWADVLLHPTFDEKEFARVRDNLLTALSRRKDSPPAVAGLTQARVLYGENHPYGWPANGTEDTIKKITPADLRKFWETYFRPNNAVLIVAGDMTEAEVRAKIEPLLKGWKAKPFPKTKIAAPAAATKQRIYLVDKAGAPQSSIRVGLIGIERRNPDYYRAMVMNNILGGSFKRLDLELREAKGWTYGVRSYFDARRTPGPWVAGGEFVAQHTAESVNAILKAVAQMREEEVSEKELQETKDEIIKGFPARFATVNQIAGQMATLAVYDLPPNELESFTKKVAAVTRADVKKAAQKYLRPGNLSIVVVGDQKAHEAALRKIAEVELRDVEGNPVGEKTAEKAAEKTAEKTAEK